MPEREFQFFMIFSLDGKKRMGKLGEMTQHQRNMAGKGCRGALSISVQFEIA
jgi:hypothetical protein